MLRPNSSVLSSFLSIHRNSTILINPKILLLKILAARAYNPEGFYLSTWLKSCKNEVSLLKGNDGIFLDVLVSIQKTQWYRDEYRI